jgi:hypothetical protein
MSSVVLDDGSVTTQTLTYSADSTRLATHDGETVTLDAAGKTTADPWKRCRSPTTITTGWWPYVSVPPGSPVFL